MSRGWDMYGLRVEDLSCILSGGCDIHERKLKVIQTLIFQQKVLDCFVLNDETNWILSYSF